MNDPGWHVVVDFKEGGAFLCQHCGESYLMNMPCSVDVWVAASRAFELLHLECPPPAVEEKK